MSKLFLLISFLASLIAVAEPKANAAIQQREQIPGPSIPGPGPSPERASYKVVEGTKDLGTIFYLLEKEMKLQRGVGHAIAGATLTVCDGDPKDKVSAFKDIDTALKTYGPDIYKTGANVLRSNGRGGNYYVPSERSITSNSTMSQIVAVLVCKQDNRSANEMAKMLTSAYNDAIAKEATHPDTKEKLSWNKDLNTLLMVAILLK